MNPRRKNISLQQIKFGILFSLFILEVFFTGCEKQAESVDFPVYGSLLLAVPLIGDETEFRDPPPLPVRITIDNESVAGWFNPPENEISFKAGIPENSRLNLRIGFQSSISLRQGDLIINLTYKRTGTNREVNLFQSRLVSGPEMSEEWIDADIPLESTGSSSGTLRLSVEGRLADNPGVKIFWGEPAIYTPDIPGRKNVLLISVDTLRVDDVTPYGAAENITPELQEFSRSAVKFSQVRAQAPWTLPSFGSMLTGVMPSHAVATTMTGYLTPRAYTIGERLLAEGFATGTVCSNTWIGNPDSGFHQGMESLWFVMNAPAEDSVARAEDFISRNSGRNWFLFLHYNNPHAPYTPPDEFRERFTDPGYSGSYDTSFDDYANWQLTLDRPDEADIEQARNLHRAEVAYVDHWLGQLFEWLDQRGISENTLIIFSADHGEEFFDHGRYGHGHAIWDELIRTPLMIRGDGFTPGIEIDTLVGNHDIVPTILDYLDLPPDENLTGIPLQDFIDPEFNPVRIIYGEDGGIVQRKYAFQWPYKCTLDFISERIQLFNVETDPGETSDISADYPDMVERLYNGIHLKMFPRRPTFILAVSGNPDDGAHRFSGAITIPGGIERVRELAFAETDSFSVDGNSVSFDITSSVVREKPMTLLIIIPEPGADEISADVEVDGISENDRFYPYGMMEPETTGHASISPLSTFPWPSSLPEDLGSENASCYLLVIPGFDPEGSDEESASVQHDPETLEQLRALGYIQ